MAKLDPLKADIIRQCQDGIRYHQGGGTGSFCKKRDLCFAERRCHFVHAVERHMERAWDIPRPGRIVWSRGFDYDPQLSLFEVA